MHTGTLYPTSVCDLAAAAMEMYHTSVSQPTLTNSVDLMSQRSNFFVHHSVGDDSVYHENGFGRTQSMPESDSVYERLIDSDSAWTVLGKRHKERIALSKADSNPITPLSESEPDGFGRTRSAPNFPSDRNKRNEKQKTIVDMFFQQELAKFAASISNRDEEGSSKEDQSQGNYSRHFIPPLTVQEASLTSSHGNSACSEDGSPLKLRTPTSHHWRQFGRRRSSSSNDVFDNLKENEIPHVDSPSRMGLMFTDAAHLVVRQ